MSIDVPLTVVSTAVIVLALGTLVTFGGHDASWAFDDKVSLTGKGDTEQGDDASSAMDTDGLSPGKIALNGAIVRWAFFGGVACLGIAGRISMRAA